MKQRIRLPLAVVILLICLPFNTEAETGNEKIDIFYLNSYHVGYPWSDNIAAGIQEVFGNSGRKLQLQIEFLNSKKFYDATIKENLFRHFKYKFRNKAFDIVIVSDNNALDFMLQYGDNLFPGIPFVFCGINDIGQYNISPGRPMTGILETISFEGTLDIARRLHPQVEKMIVIGNDSVTSKSISDQIKEDIRVNKIDFEIQFRNDLRSETLIESLHRESKKIMLYIIPAYEEIKGEFYSSWELTEKVFKATGLPVYGSWEFVVGYGQVGGKVVSGKMQGRLAAQLALRIIGGEDPASIPYVADPGHIYLFDYNILQYFKIKKDQLPAESVLINEPYNFYRLNRTIFWAIVVGVILLIGVILLLVFNTAQKNQANLAMKESKTKLRMILDNIPQLVFWQDLELRFMDVNRSFLGFFNVKDYQDIIGRNDYDILGEGTDVQRVKETNYTVMKTQKPQYRIRWDIRRHDGDIVWLEVNKIPFHDKNGNVVGVLSTAEDVTRKIDLEKQLRQSQKMEALGILSGGIAHDFNNILTSIINSAELAIEDVPEGSLTREDLKRILNASFRGSNLVKQILTFSRPSHQEFRPINLVKTVNESLELIKSSMPGNITIQEDISHAAVFCLGNPTQIHQIVMNLCTNSFQAMKDAGGTIRVSLNECYLDAGNAEKLNTNPGDFVELSVSDDGPGIDGSIIDKVFDPFFSTKSKNIGTGLGLSVVHGIVKGHNGGISVTSEKSQKTEFKIYVPRMEEKLIQKGQTDSSLHFGNEHILFVEDDADQRASVPRALETLGYKVESADSAENALSKFQSAHHHFDLIITDYDMPRTNGLNLAREIRKLSPDTPIIMVSGRQFNYQEEDFDNIKRLVIKPYDKFMISGVVRQVMNEIGI